VRTLDPLKPPGTYKVDAHTSVLFPIPKGTKSIATDATLRAAQIAEIDARIGNEIDPRTGEKFRKVINENVAVEAIRAEVNRAAQIAEVRARTESSDLREARAHAEQLLKLLEIVERDAAKCFPAGDAGAAAADLSLGFVKTADAISVVQPLVEIIGNIDSLRTWGTELQKRASIAPSPASHSDPLARYFIQAMRVAYLARRKKQPPRGRSGPFIRLLAAAWLDLGFPRPPASKDDLEGWLGQKVQDLEELPVLTTKQSYQNL
jgi:hypothetical protein